MKKFKLFTATVLVALVTAGCPGNAELVQPEEFCDSFAETYCSQAEDCGKDGEVCREYLTGRHGCVIWDNESNSCGEGSEWDAKAAEQCLNEVGALECNEYLPEICSHLCK